MCDVTKRFCRWCGCVMREVKDCILVDRYYICDKCGQVDMTESKELTSEDNEKRLIALGQTQKRPRYEIAQGGKDDQNIVMIIDHERHEKIGMSVKNLLEPIKELVENANKGAGRGKVIA